MVTSMMNIKFCQLNVLIVSVSKPFILCLAMRSKVKLICCLGPPQELLHNSYAASIFTQILIRYPRRVISGNSRVELDIR